MKTLGKALFAFLPALILLVPTPAFATAWSPWKYELSVPSGSGPWADYCVRAGIVDTAINRVDMQTHTNTASCSGGSQNVPSGYFAGQVSGYRDGSFCGQSAVAYSTSATWGINFSATMCSNPSGSQSFSTIGFGGIYDNGNKGGTVGYHWFSRTSPSQAY